MGTFLLCALFFYLASFCLCVNRIDRYAHSPKSKIFSNKISQITTKLFIEVPLKGIYIKS